MYDSSLPASLPSNPPTSYQRHQTTEPPPPPMFSVNKLKKKKLAINLFYFFSLLHSHSYRRDASAPTRIWNRRPPHRVKTANRRHRCSVTTRVISICHKWATQRPVASIWATWPIWTTAALPAAQAVHRMHHRQAAVVIRRVICACTIRVTVRLRGPGKCGEEQRCLLRLLEFFSP